MSATTRILAVAFGLFGLGAPLLAHHAFSSEYDENKVVTFKGTVTKIEWTNPHARFFVDVVNPDKTVTNWSFELASPNSLTREGWDRHTLTVGDAISVSGFAAKSGKSMASTRTVTTPDGKALFGGTQGIQ
jgi:predicted small integral membrane protein